MPVTIDNARVTVFALTARNSLGRFVERMQVPTGRS
jgi:hypothetical protein